jgi:hypothetical protein
LGINRTGLTEALRRPLFAQTAVRVLYHLSMDAEHQATLAFTPIPAYVCSLQVAILCFPDICSSLLIPYHISLMAFVAGLSDHPTHYSLSEEER